MACIRKKCKAFIQFPISGDILVSVNDTCVLGFSEEELAAVFSSLPPRTAFRLDVCRGYPLRKANPSIRPPSLASDQLRRNPSLSGWWHNKLLSPETNCHSLRVSYPVRLKHESVCWSFEQRFCTTGSTEDSLLLCDLSWAWGWGILIE